jgi:hypothetical protein
VSASIFDFELIEETGVRMSPSAPAQAKSFTPDMHTCIIVAPHGVHASAGTYRVITTTKTPPSEFGFGKLAWNLASRWLGEHLHDADVRLRSRLQDAALGSQIVLPNAAKTSRYLL